MSNLAIHRYYHTYLRLTNPLSLLLTQIALFFMGIFIYLTFAFFKPYQNRLANFIEAIVLIDLLLLTSLFLNTNTQVQASVRPLSQLLLLLPFISVTIYIVAKTASIIWWVHVISLEGHVHNYRNIAIYTPLYIMCRKKAAPESFKIFYTNMLDRCSQALKFLSPLQESKAPTEIQTLDEDNDDLQSIRNQVSICHS